MTPLRQPMIEQPIEENLRKAYGKVAHDAPVPDRLAELMRKLAARQDGAGKTHP